MNHKAPPGVVFLCTPARRWVHQILPKMLRPRRSLGSCDDPDAKVVFIDWVTQEGFGSRGRGLVTCQHIPSPFPFWALPYSALGLATSTPVFWLVRGGSVWTLGATSVHSRKPQELCPLRAALSWVGGAGKQAAQHPPHQGVPTVSQVPVG